MLAFRFRPLLAGLALSLWAGASFAQAAPCDDPAVARTAGAVSLAYQDLGEADRPAVILVAGTDQQMIDWPTSLIEGLKAAGYRPVVYDGRDVGCSATFDAAGPPDWPAFFGQLMKGETPETAYTLTNLGADLLSVADSLALPRFHIIAASGGATVASQVAAQHPERIASLVLLMANSGDPAIPLPADPARMAALPPPPPADAPSETVVAYRVAASTALEGSAMRTPAEDILRRAIDATARAWHPDGIARYGAALLASGDRRPTLRSISAPTAVIHGAEDPLISPAHGRAVADAIPGASFTSIEGLGHALPDAAVPEILRVFATVAKPAGAQP